ncbi:hypothetical protein GP486_006538 [Trichoglossum hirsutum]|uniref:Pentatricopeptide repeat-containing protein n=1 Tax=Trichoglossum hirsutum TaxID=265104 RepID=A0A9P8IDD4_9PEZI|nr:hypothetical protein GP486_006538 [Trichoglossum hirsutum]
MKYRRIQTLRSDPCQHGRYSPIPPSHPADQSRSRGDSISKAILSDIEATRHFQNLAPRDKILLSLRRRDPDLLIRLLLNVRENESVICSIPRTTFSEILQLLCPSYFVDPSKRTHNDPSSATAEVLGIKPIQPIFAEFFNDILRIVKMRRLTGHPLGLNDYISLLNCARACGDTSAAIALWRDMERDGVLPNTACYNHYMAVRCFPSVSDPHHRHTLRATSDSLRNRKATLRDIAFSGFSAGKGGIKDQVMQLFDDMILRGLGEGNSKTFCIVMIAAARDGDIAGVKSVLNKVWGVDVDALLRDEEPLDLVEKHREDSPLFPDTFLLYAIAHAFGSNNDIPTALRTVDYVSRQYSIPISPQVWAHLLEWTFVLSIPRFGQNRPDGAPTGKLPLHSVQSLWETMVAEPYNIRPTMSMYNRYIKSLFLRQSLGQAQRMMEEGLVLYRLSTKRSMAEKRRYLLAKSLWATSEPNLGLLRKRMELAETDARRNRLFVERWVRLLIAGIGLAGKNLEWERVSMPNIVEKWRPFLPPRVHYLTTGGSVSFTPSGDFFQ